MESNYSVSNITVMEGLDAVRMRPGMYIGTTGPKGLHHLLWEIVDNAIDEAANGYANEINVTLNKDGSATVFDNGRGIPVGIHEKLGVSGVEVVFTQLHAGGKFGYDSYGYSGGLHGVGASVVNALSRWVTVEVFTQNRSYKQEFESAEGEDGKIVSGRPKYPLTETGRTRKQGSLITFMPDDRVFETVEWSYDVIMRRLRELAYLNRGVKLTLSDQRPGKIGGEDGRGQNASTHQRGKRCGGGLQNDDGAATPIRQLLTEDHGPVGDGWRRGEVGGADVEELFPHQTHHALGQREAGFGNAFPRQLQQGLLVDSGQGLPSLPVVVVEHSVAVQHAKATLGQGRIQIPQVAELQAVAVEGVGTVDAPFGHGVEEFLVLTGEAGHFERGALGHVLARDGLQGGDDGVADAVADTAVLQIG